MTKTVKKVRSFTIVLIQVNVDRSLKYANCNKHRIFCMNV